MLYVKSNKFGKPISCKYAHGFPTPSIKEMQDEYLRMSNPHLPINITRILDATTTNRDSLRPTRIIVNVKAPSMTALAEGISTDSDSLNADFLIITHSWIDIDKTFPIE